MNQELDFGEIKDQQYIKAPPESALRGSTLN
jgi:hypothetical protein